MGRQDEINAKMVKLCPELASQYAKYPLKRKQWLSPNAKVDDKTKAFIASQSDTGPKPDYVFGPGPLSMGYYHILTRNAYKILYVRLTKEQPPVACCCFASKDSHNAYDEWYEVKTICYNRSIASIPDDAQARDDAITIARGEALAHYHEQQNFQLVVMAVT